MSAAASEYSPRAEALRLGGDDRGSGWVLFAATVLLVLACSNILEGVAAVGGSQFFVRDAHYLFGDLTSWGWTIWLLGIAQGLTSLAILVRNQFARWLGVAFAALNGLSQLLMIQAYPSWSLALFALDILVIYGLVVFGGRTYRAA